MRKWINILFVIFVLTLLMTVPVAAQEIDQEEKTGSIQVNLTDAEGKKLEKEISLQCVKVADIEGAEYNLTETFSESKIDFNKITTSIQLQEAADQLSSQEFKGDVIKSDQDGVVKFENLKTGIYLINTKSNGAKKIISPTLLSIPMWNDVTCEMEYDITVYPKYMPTEQEESPKTGDQGNLHIYLLGVCGCLGVILCRRKIK